MEKQGTNEKADQLIDFLEKEVSKSFPEKTESEKWDIIIYIIHKAQTLIGDECNIIV